ncbi:hypothetical protein NL676_030444 [Syzygium grande]|nr:hypothetical protein NL676_030444 [Syzygium grande]
MYCCAECEMYLHRSCAKAPYLAPGASPPTLQMSQSDCGVWRISTFILRVVAFHLDFGFAVETLPTRSQRSDLSTIIDIRVTPLKKLCHGYDCKKCGSNLDPDCMISTLPLERPTEEDLTVLHLFARPHPLMPFSAEMRIQNRCGGCQHEISGDFYGCRGCSFFLHL